MRTLSVILAVLSLSSFALESSVVPATQYRSPPADSEEEFQSRGRPPIFIRGEYVPFVYIAFEDFKSVLLSSQDWCTNQIGDYLISVEETDPNVVAIAFVPHHGRESECWDRFGIDATYFIDKRTLKIMHRRLGE